MSRTPLTTMALLAGLAVVVPAQAGHAQGGHAQGGHAGAGQAQGAPPAAPAPGDDRLVASALSAAPASVAANATLMTLDGRTLRTGTSGWVCMPDDPAVPGNSPMCLDEPWREVIDAWLKKRTPTVRTVGFGYMLQGDMPVSNVDPFATGPTPDNHWLAEGVPHVMIVLPDNRLLEGLPTDPHNGGPWVMWKGTPYAHIMVPAVAKPER